MPSKTPKQARLMAAVAHGWKPDQFKGPPVAVAKEFNQADKGRGILSRAAGGMVKPVGQQIQPPVLGHVQSPLGQAIQNKGNAGRYAGGMGLAPARPPRVPVQGMFRNIDQGIKQNKVQLKALGGQIDQPTPPPQSGDPNADRIHQVVMTALGHLQNMDASSAAAVLRSSPEAMSHPEIAQVENALRNSAGITPATKTLNQISQDAPEPAAPQMQKLLPPLQSPGGGQPPGQPGQPPSSGMPGPPQVPGVGSGSSQPPSSNNGQMQPPR